MNLEAPKLGVSIMRVSYDSQPRHTRSFGAAMPRPHFRRGCERWQHLSLIQIWRVVTCSTSNLYFYPRSVDLISFQTGRITKSSTIQCQILSITGADPDYEILDIVGQGTFGIVMKVRKRFDRQASYRLLRYLPTE
jgi:hypothetical protein